MFVDDINNTLRQGVSALWELNTIPGIALLRLLSPFDGPNCTGISGYSLIYPAAGYQLHPFFQLVGDCAPGGLTECLVQSLFIRDT
jgi:hypothetical protein